MRSICIQRHIIASCLCHQKSLVKGRGKQEGWADVKLLAVGKPPEQSTPARLELAEVTEEKSSFALCVCLQNQVFGGLGSC